MIEEARAFAEGESGEARIVIESLCDALEAIGNHSYGLLLATAAQLYHGDAAAAVTDAEELIHICKERNEIH